MELMENYSDTRAIRAMRDVSIGASEAEVRVDLAACYRLVALYAMTDLASNHITARVPGQHDYFFINPFGMLYEEVTASSLYKIDLQGKVVERPDVPYGVNTVGYVIHSAIHAARPDVVCVLHTHTRAGVAVSCMEGGLQRVHQNAMLIADQVVYHDYEGPVTTGSERRSLVRDLGSKKAMIMRNHGLLTCGSSVAEAFYYMYRLNAACQIQVDLMASGARIHQPSAQSLAAMDEFMEKYMDVTQGNLEWPSLKRKLDRVLPGYEL